MAQYFGERNMNGIKLEYPAPSSGLRGAQIPAFGVFLEFFWTSKSTPKWPADSTPEMLQSARKLYIMFTRDSSEVVA